MKRADGFSFASQTPSSWITSIESKGAIKGAKMAIKMKKM
jgi:hypothetical protein